MADWDTIFKSINITHMVILSVVFVLGVLGNGVVIWATGFRMKKTVNTVWYLNLAVADFLLTAFLPLDITWLALDGHWPFGWFMCKMEAMVFHVNMYASVFTLVVISVDSCVCVVCPVWSQNHRTVRKASWLSLGVWVLALALSSAYFIFRDTVTFTHYSYNDGDEVVTCYDNYALVADWDEHTPEARQLIHFRFGAMVITRFLVGFVVPFSVIVSCYSVIYRLRNNLSPASRSGCSFKIMATVIGAFLQCWVPYHIIHLIQVYVLTTEREFSVGLSYVIILNLGYLIAHILAIANSCLKPLLYMFMGQGRGFKDVFRSGSILKVLEKAFAEEPQTNDTPTDPDDDQMIALSEMEGSTGRAFAYSRF